MHNLSSTAKTMKCDTEFPADFTKKNRKRNVRVYVIYLLLGERAFEHAIHSADNAGSEREH